METLSASKFKATCLAVLDQVARTGEPVLVTKHGKPVAQVIPPVQVLKNNGIGCMVDPNAPPYGDVVSPVFDPADFEDMYKEWDELGLGK